MDMTVPEADRAESRHSEAGLDARSRIIFENIFDLFGTLDLDGRITDLHGRIFNRTGSNPALLVGQPFSETVFWQSSERTARIVEKAVADASAGSQADVVVDFRVSADERIPVELQLQPFSSDAGKAEIFICGRTRPVIGEAGDKSVESELLLRTAENAGIGLWFWEIDEARIYSTASCNELLGLPGHEPVTFESFLTVVHPNDRAYVESLFERLQTESIRYEDEFRVVRSDGSVDWIAAEGKSISDSGDAPNRMMGIVRCVTEQKLAAEELAKVYDRERRARDEAVEANRAKDFFLAFVSHELRSPLNAILGWSKILLTKNVDDDTRRNALQTIERSARLQTKLINDLVDSARVASGKLRLEFHPTNVADIARTAYQAQKPTAEAQHLDFSFECDREEIVVFGDAGRLQQVLTNLISNAIKFTPEGGKVLVRIETSDDEVSISVKDTGQGIGHEALPNIFRQFSQGEIGRTRSSNSGLGLGLSIVKILVGKHGGAVQAKSEGLGHGAEFIVTLPLSDSRPRTTLTGPEGAMDRRPLAERKILVVEDDPDSREVLQLFLEQSGARVFSAESAKAAMEILGRRADRLPDLIISDLAMPDEDGYSLLSRIRKLPEDQGGQIPAIALSAFTTIESKQRAYDSGFQLYSTKPFEPDRLVADILQLTTKTN